MKTCKIITNKNCKRRKFCELQAGVQENLVTFHRHAKYNQQHFENNVQNIIVLPQKYKFRRFKCLPNGYMRNGGRKMEFHPKKLSADRQIGSGCHLNCGGSPIRYMESHLWWCPGTPDNEMYHPTARVHSCRPTNCSGGWKWWITQTTRRNE